MADFLALGEFRAVRTGPGLKAGCAMQEPTFEKIAAEAAAGFQGDRELYLDVTQELVSHLEEKADRFHREGHDEAESAEMAKKSFGSPLDMAAELLAANRQRLRLRTLFRLTFAALIVPLAVVLALYVGYGRVARLYQMSAIFTDQQTSQLPTLPLIGLDTEATKKAPIIRELEGAHHAPDKIYRYWEMHRTAPESQRYYAYYATCLQTEDEQAYMTAMRRGERLEPENALYNVLLAQYYLSHGMIAQEEQPRVKGKQPPDKLKDRRTFELGIAELLKAVKKPYFCSYQMHIVQQQLNALPRPMLTEDYIQRIAFKSTILFPQFVRYRTLAREISGCARLLATEGRTTEAEAVMDTWKPYTVLLTTDDNNTLIGGLVTLAVGTVLTKQGDAVYQQLGRQEKAREMAAIHQRLSTWKTARHRSSIRSDQLISQHGPRMFSMMLSTFGNTAVPQLQELTPTRMHEHVLIEEGIVQAVLILLALALLGTLLQGIFWLHRLRRAAAVPVLLMPPAREIARALFFGIVLPAAIYWCYSRLPVLGGREYGFASAMWPRFAMELLLLVLLMLWLPERIIKRYIRKRCVELDIAVPTVREETRISRMVRGVYFTALVLAAIAIFFLGIDGYGLLFKLAGVILAVLLSVAAFRHAWAKRQEFGLYYGTLARSLAPVYAFAIILLALSAEPLLLQQEARWLRQDTLVFGGLADQHNQVASCTAMETRAAESLRGYTLKALGE